MVMDLSKLISKEKSEKRRTREKRRRQRRKENNDEEVFGYGQLHRMRRKVRGKRPRCRRRVRKCEKQLTAETTIKLLPVSLVNTVFISSCQNNPKGISANTQHGSHHAHTLLQLKTHQKKTKTIPKPQAWLYKV